MTAGTQSSNATIVLAGNLCAGGAGDDSLVSQFDKQVAPRLLARGVILSGVFVTELAPNTFTRLPVREREQLLVWIGTMDGPPGPRLDRRRHTLAGHVPAVLDLEPTSRSLLGGGARPLAPAA